jgi:hypothetical protein
LIIKIKIKYIKNVKAFHVMNAKNLMINKFHASIAPNVIMIYVLNALEKIIIKLNFFTKAILLNLKIN